MAGLSEEEGKRLLELFGKLKLKPKLDSEEALQDWLSKMGSSGDEEKPPQPPAVVTQPHWPKISGFSGEQPSKHEVAFEEWKYEVQCLLKDGTYAKSAILHAIRKSLHGEAGRIARRLGPDAGIGDIVDKLQGVYGTVERGEALLGEFYGATQKEDEDVATWSCRLEDLLDKARSRGYVSPEGSDEMLRTKCWLGLRPSLRDASSHKFDVCKTFDKLIVELRIIEHDRRSQKSMEASVTRKAQLKAAVNVEEVGASRAQGESPQQKTLDEIKGMICSLSEKYTKLEEKVDRVSRPHMDLPSETYRSQDTGSQPHLNFNPRPMRGRGRGNYGSREPVCWRCGQVGHVQLGCRVILDHQQQPPNGRQPATRGRR